MDQRATGTSDVNPSNSPSSSAAPRQEGRNVWILTVYGISGLALLGVLAYFFSSYIAH